MTDLITAETTGSAARSDGTIFSFGFDQGERDQTCLTIGRRMTHDGTLVITAALFGPDAKAVYDLVSALHAELAQARADAKAAVGLAIERAEVAAKNVATGFHDGISGDWHPYSGLTMINETCKAIRAIAPEDAIAEVTEWKRLAIAGNLIALEMRNMEAERDRLANELAAAHDKYQRDVFGLNNEGDPIGGDPPSGLKQRADKAEAELAAANAREAGLRDFIGDFANAKIDALRYQPSYGESPEDEPDPVVDAETVWAWQADAKSALAQPSTEGGA